MSIRFAPGPIKNQRLPSPEETKRSLLATELMREMASEVEPIYSPVQGIAKLGMGALSGFMGARAERRADEADRGFSADLAKGLGGFGGGSGSGASASASPLSFGGPFASAGPSASSPAGGARAAAGGPTGVSDGFMASLIGTESGGRWDAQNDVSGAGGHKGHFGRLQFGQARLAEAAAAGVIPQGTSPQAFMANPDAQRAVETWHFADIDAQAERRGLTQFVGQMVGGVPITQDGIRAMAHLGGIGGAERFLKSGGRHNPADAYGTSLRDYARKHGGASAGAEQIGVAHDPSRPYSPTQVDQSQLARDMQGGTQVASLDPSIGMPAPRVPQGNAALAEAVNPAGAPQVGPQQRELASAVMSYDPASVPQAPAQDPRMVAQMVDPNAGQGAYMDQQRQMIVEMLNSPNPQTRAAGQAMAPQFMDDYRSHQQAMQTRAYEQQVAAQRQAYERAVLMEQRGYDASLRQDERGYDAYVRGDQRQYDATLTAEERAYDDAVRQQGYQREDQRNAYTDGRQIVRDARADMESDRSFEHSQAQLVPTSVREYDQYAADETAAGRQPLGRMEYEQALRRSSAANTTINTGDPTGGSGEFYNHLDKANADMFGTILAAGPNAQTNLARIDRLEGMLGELGSGWANQATMIAGNLGIDLGNASGVQAAQALINSMVPEQRAPGSGPMSDADLELFKQSLPRIINSPEGNRRIIETLRGIAQYQLSQADIAGKVAARQITPEAANELLRNLPNPVAWVRDAELPQTPISAPVNSDGVTTITSKEAYDALPSGTQFRDPNGEVRTKP